MLDQAIMNLQTASNLISNAEEIVYRESQQHVEGAEEACLYIAGQLDFLAGIVSKSKQDLEDLKEELE